MHVKLKRKRRPEIFGISLLEGMCDENNKFPDAVEKLVRI